MFYSQLLLSKKGALGVVWMAAHCRKGLKKDQVQQTNVSSSVDKILNDEVPVVTHRILAFLLLGVVRIYSKKVEYLFHDCQEALNKLHDFRTGKSKHEGIGVSQTNCHSIMLPKRFELDAFDLEHLEDQDLMGGNVRSDEQVMLTDGHHKDCDSYGPISKENMPFSEAYSTANTPPREDGNSFCLGDCLDAVFDEAEEEQMHNKPSEEDPRTNFEGPIKEKESDNTNHSVPSSEILRGTQFPPKDNLETMILDEAEKEQKTDRLSNDNIGTNVQGPIKEMEFNSVACPSPQGSDLVAIFGVFHKSGFSLEHSPGLKMLNEAEKGQGRDEPSNKVHGDTGQHVEQLRTRMSFQEGEPHDSAESVDKAKPVTLKKMKILEVNTPECKKGQRIDEATISIVTSCSKPPDAVVGIAEVSNVQTPPTKERGKIQKKRKTLFDQTTVLPNKLLKNWIEEDPSDLKRERRKVGWRAGKLGHVPQSFLDPSVSGISMELSSLASQHDAMSPVTRAVHEKILDVGSPVKHTSPEQTPIGPGTPVTNLTSLRSQEIRAVADSDILQPTISPESIEKWPPSNEGLELDSMFWEEANSFDKDCSERDTYSARTRMAGSYLSRKFLEKKRENKEEALNTSQLLGGKTRKQSARIFYEILVLKTGDCIDVEQVNAYDDILLRQTSKN